MLLLVVITLIYFIIRSATSIVAPLRNGGIEETSRIRLGRITFSSYANRAPAKDFLDSTIVTVISANTETLCAVRRLKMIFVVEGI